MIRARLLAIALLCVGSASAQTVWQRAQGGVNQQVLNLRHSVQRVAEGMGDELDLFRMRAALVSLSRGELQDASTVVSLMGLRRELGLSPGEKSAAALVSALKGSLEPLERARGYEELAHIYLQEHQRQRALAEIERALSLAWTVNARARMFNLKAWLLIAANRYLDAEEALQAVERLRPSKRVLLQLRVARALLAAERGDAEGFFSEASRAHRLALKRAAVSDRGLFWDLSLSPELEAAGEASLVWGRVLELDSQGKHQEAQNLRLGLCDAETRERSSWLPVDGECDAPAEGALQVEQP